VRDTTVRTDPASNPVSRPATLVRVLVADPDPDTRALYCAAFSLAGCEVSEACDGREALTKALAELPTILVSELRLPLVDGYALCEILRRDAVTRSLPILIVTAEARLTELDQIRKRGADAVLVKPTPPDAILGEMRQLIPGARTVRDISPTKPTGLLRSDEHRRTLSKSHSRFSTTTPPAPPPALNCPSCDHSLRYEHSHVGGVSDRFTEQWDYYNCSSCGTFQYRHRTRKVRRVA
jgi:CheY-like chemotaxis protein